MQDLNELKELLFKERVRLNQERESLEEDKKEFDKKRSELELQDSLRKSSLEFQAKKLEMERQLFDKKLDVLQREYRRLARDKECIQKEKDRLEESKRYRNRTVHQVTYSGKDILFQGVNNELALKKRYRELLKIFHPDNLNGDKEVLQNINHEYNSLKRMYG